MALKLPKHASAAFRIESADVFGCRFSINLYTASDRGSWFVATYRSDGEARDSGARELPDEDWATLMEMMDRCRFWSLPADGDRPDLTLLLDGEWLTVTGRDHERHHRVHRLVAWEKGLEEVLFFARRVFGLFNQR